jgi:hypothetical protein
MHEFVEFFKYKALKKLTDQLRKLIARNTGCRRRLIYFTSDVDVVGRGSKFTSLIFLRVPYSSVSKHVIAYSRLAAAWAFALSTSIL